MKRRSLTLLLWIALSTGSPALGEAIDFQRTDDAAVNLTVRDAPISEIFEMLSRKERVNILLGEGVEGRVSVSLFDVSLGEAIRSIADAAGFFAERRGQSYVIIKRDDAGKDSAGGTSLRVFDLEYSEPGVVETLVKKHLSRYGEVSVLADRRILVVEDLPEFVARIERLIAAIDREPRQILLEAKILEISLDDSMTLGVDWTHTFAVDDGSATVGMRDLASSVAPGLFFDLMTSKIEVSLNALANKGRVRTLSTPSLLALEHEEAEVVIGDRLGYRVTTTINQVTTESVEFIESGIILRFTAAVDKKGRIILEVHPEVSSSDLVDGIPSLKTTEVTTTLVLDDGQRIFIAGLIKDGSTDSRVGVPFLSNIPLLGLLFSRSQREAANTETVVILSAHLVDGTAGELIEEKDQRLPGVERELEDQREDMRHDLDDDLTRIGDLMFQETDPDTAALEAPDGQGWGPIVEFEQP